MLNLNHRSILGLSALFLLFFINIPLVRNQEGKKFNAALEISVEKNHFLKHENIWVKFRIENKGEIGPRFGNNKYDNWVVIDKNGTRYVQNIHISYANIQPMKPGEVYEDEVNVISFMEHPDSLPTCHEYGNYWPPGRYQIQRVWDERRYEPLSSNIVEVIVSDPEGDEKEAMYLLRQGIKLKNYDLSDKKYWELFKRYPNSVYALLALYNIIRIHFYAIKIKDIEKGMIAGKELLKVFPESRHRGRAFYIIRKYYRKKGDNEGAKEYFRTLKNTTQSLKVKEITEKILKKIDDGKL